MTKEKVSIIVPVYNMGKTLEACIQSLLKQTYDNVEIILIDDGSSDNTFDICKKYKKKSSKIKSWHTENRGSGPARNLGIEKASGDYAYFMDADDILESEAISVLVEKITKEKSNLIVFGYRKVDNKGKLLTTKKYSNESFSGIYVRENYHLFFDMNFKRGIQGPPWNKLFDLKIIKENVIKYPNMKRHQDEVFISRYMSYVNRVSFIDSILYTHYINDVTLKQSKFPLTYIDIVNELYNHRLETVAKWNKDNKRVLSLIYIEYIYNSIKAFDIIFTSKANMIKEQRLDWIEKKSKKIPVNKDLLNVLPYNNKLKIKQINRFLDFVEKGDYKKIYIMIKFRMILEIRFSTIIKFVKKNMIVKLGKQ